jgi:hypothetical protein
MTLPAGGGNDEFFDLLYELAEDRLSPQKAARLETLLLADPARRQQYVDFMVVVSILHRTKGLGLEFGESLSCGTGGAVAAGVDRQSSAIAVPHSVVRSSYSSLLTLNSTVGSFLFSYAAATVIVSVGILIAWTCHVSDPQAGRSAIVYPSPRPNAHRPHDLPQREVISVAGVTEMIDCTWTDRTQAPSVQRIVLGTKFALASGLMEITYDTGAKVVLQGPSTYTVESRTGGYLEQGKLTARVDKKADGRRGKGEDAKVAKETNQKSEIRNQKSPFPPPPSPLFSIRTPTAVVNDLGTEFGVEVDENNESRVHVFVGAVDLAPAGKPSCGIRIAAGDARRISAATGGTVQKIAFYPDGFAKPRAVLAGKYRREALLFHDGFASFALGTRWRPANGEAPDEALEAVSHDRHPALRMKSSAAKAGLCYRGIESVEAFSVQKLASIQADVTFQTSEEATPAFQVWFLGSSAKTVRMILEPYQRRRIGLDTHVVEKNRFDLLDRQYSDSGVYQDGRRYRAVLTVDRRGVQVAVQDDVNKAVVHRAKLTSFTLADLGDTTRVVLRLVTRTSHSAECWVYDVTVRGRSSATRDASSHNTPLGGARHTFQFSSVKPQPPAPSH